MSEEGRQDRVSCSISEGNCFDHPPYIIPFHLKTSHVNGLWAEWKLSKLMQGMDEQIVLSAVQLSLSRSAGSSQRCANPNKVDSKASKVIHILLDIFLSREACSNRRSVHLNEAAYPTLHNSTASLHFPYCCCDPMMKPLPIGCQLKPHHLLLTDDVSHSPINHQTHPIFLHREQSWSPSTPS